MSATGRGGADPLAAPDARHRRARRVHPAARGDRADRRRSAGGCCSRPAARAPRWRAAGYPIGIAVNVSARQLDSDQLIADIERALADSGLEPAALTIEITETTLMRNIEETVAPAASDQGSSACASRSTTSAPATPRSPTCSVPGRRAEDRPLVHLRAQAQQGGRDADPHARAARQGARRSRRSRRASSSSTSCRCCRDEDCDNGQGFLFARPLDAAAIEAFFQRSGTPTAVTGVSAGADAEPV